MSQLDTSEVRDITASITIVIEEGDRKAWQCDPWECVIANALNRNPKIRGAQVGAQYVRFFFKGVWVRGELDRNSRNIIKAYDKDGQIMPAGIEIHIDPPNRRVSYNNTRNKQSTGPRLRVGQIHEPSTRNIFVKPLHEREGH